MTPDQVRQFIHTEIQFEHQLISNRMTWYITSQSFLMTAFAISGSETNQFQWLLKWVLPPLGILISVILFFSLRAAFDSMDLLRKEEKKLVRANKEFHLILF